MKNIKINLKSQLYNWYDFFLQTILFIPLCLYLYNKYSSTSGFIVFYIFLLIQFSFTFYLHLVYYLKNKGENFSIKEDKIERVKNGQKEVFYSADIKKIVICKSANMDKWGIPYTTFESFRVARVYLKDGRSFIMTNLLEYDLEKPLQILKGVKFERRKGFSFFI
ncbi:MULTISPECIES: hypothetical protein [Flavobacterium]|uniref:PH domain-containing protein n=1 Tax=Flavobacterium keumense TaxID=1306518 RepID=A0ABY8N676_9FLAO|nr:MULTISPECIES: hypothetical protein [Flavobacterium]WGK95145.1 hypothetical protein MG292_02635 [Flavobacterium keumense]